MSHPPSTTEIDPAQIERAAHGWNVFTKYGKWAVYHVIALLALMAVFLL